MFHLKPAVFAVKDSYQIFVRTDCNCTMWVQVGDNCYYDESNGILRSETDVHRMIVPMEELDREKRYTICGRRMPNREPYFNKAGDLETYAFSFTPVTGENPRFYQIADAHNQVDIVVEAAKAYGKIDFLVLNGDIPEGCDTMEGMNSLYEICSALTEGTIPIVFARGNHDMRGKLAERFENYSPTDMGNSYYTFRLGNIWGIVLDCGEDKADESIEYGHTICCHGFRLRETKFLQRVAESEEYKAPGIMHRLVVCHNPFYIQHKEKLFAIEKDIYTQWCDILKTYIKPTLMLCGHLHRMLFCHPGDERDHLGLPCLSIVSPTTKYGEKYISCGVELRAGEAEITVTDQAGDVLETSIYKT